MGIDVSTIDPKKIKLYGNGGNALPELNSATVIDDLKENAIKVVEDFNFEAPKTKEFVTITKNLKTDSEKLLLVLSERNNCVYLSARNLQKVNVVIASELNTYKVLDNKYETEIKEFVPVM